jgi:hypothetical protein
MLTNANGSRIDALSPRPGGPVLRAGVLVNIGWLFGSSLALSHPPGPVERATPNGRWASWAVRSPVTDIDLRKIGRHGHALSESPYGLVPGLFHDSRATRWVVGYSRC